MSRRRRWFLAGLLPGVILLALTGWGEQVRSQEKYPAKPIDIIVSYAPGGGVDISARLLASYMNKKWGQPVNVINKPGGNHVPACLELYQADPNGYTLLEDSIGSSAILSTAVKNLPFKIMDRSFIGIFTMVPMVLLVHPAAPFKTLKDLEEDAKKDPGSFTWTSIGGASPQDYTIRKFLKLIGVDVFKTKPIMSQGASQAVTLTAGGNVKVGVASLSASLAAIKGGMVRPLAMTSKTRFPDVPDLPTTAELGYPGVDILDRYGPSGPPKLPSHVVDAWNKAMAEMVKDPGAASKMRNAGLMPLHLNSAETRDYVAKTMEELKELYGLK